MERLLNSKEKLIVLLSRNEIYIRPALKFVVALIALFMINGAFGYSSLLGNPGVILILGLVCMFMPKTGIMYVIAFYTAGSVYSVSLEYFAVFVFIMLIVMLLYMQFAPEYAYLIVISALAASLNVPFAVVALAGLLAGPAAVVPVACGSLIFYILNYIPKYIEAVNVEELGSVVEKLQHILNNVLLNREMFLSVGSAVLVLLTVYIIKRLEIRYAWRTALISGAVLYVLIMGIGGVIFDASVPFLKLLVGVVISGIICVLVIFFVRNLDYKRIEKVQFEDEEYYYYVKAVPKKISGKDTKR